MRIQSGMVVALMIGGVLGSVGCRFNPRFCDDNPGHNCTLDQDAPIAPECTSNEQCAAPTAVCELGTQTCVQCTTAEATACMGTTPVCSADDTCQACTAHDQCSSNACLPDGSCGDADTNVAYLDEAGSDNTTCSKEMPCTKVAKAVATGRPFVKFHGTINDQVSLTSTNVTFLADPGAKLTSTSNGILLKIDGTSIVAIYDLEISGASGPTSPGISMQAGNTATLSIMRGTISGNDGGGISATGGSLTVSRSTISGNTGGGISVMSGTFDITNSFITGNGSQTSPVGGASLAPVGAGNRFEFNTVVDNQVQSGVTHGGGVVCDVATFSAPNNIVARNLVNLDANQANSNTQGVCTFPTSAIATTLTAFHFASPDTSPFDYHLTAGSSAIDQATTPTTVTIDFDGETRPRGTAPDQGADEVQ